MYRFLKNQKQTHTHIPPTHTHTQNPITKHSNVVIDLQSPSCAEELIYSFLHVSIWSICIIQLETTVGEANIELCRPIPKYIYTKLIDDLVLRRMYESHTSIIPNSPDPKMGFRTVGKHCNVSWMGISQSSCVNLEVSRFQVHQSLKIPKSLLFWGYQGLAGLFWGWQGTCIHSYPS